MGWWRRRCMAVLRGIHCGVMNHYWKPRTLMASYFAKWVSSLLPYLRPFPRCLSLPFPTHRDHGEGWHGRCRRGYAKTVCDAMLCRVGDLGEDTAGFADDSCSGVAAMLTYTRHYNTHTSLRASRCWVLEFLCFTHCWFLSWYLASMGSSVISLKSSCLPSRNWMLFSIVFTLRRLSFVSRSVCLSPRQIQWMMSS